MNQTPITVEKIYDQKDIKIAQFIKGLRNKIAKKIIIGVSLL